MTWGRWFAPGRANLMGEHTDYNEGFVLPFALAQGVTATAKARDDGLLVLRSKQVPDDPVTVAIDGLAPGVVTGWAAYPAGVAWSLRTSGLDVAGASIDIDSDLPVGAGVSSSAALECSVALALCSLSGVSVDRPALAAIAKRAENEFVGAPTGIIDQSAALLCREGHAMLLDCGTLEITHVPFRPGAAGVTAVVIDTRVTHALVSRDYAWRRIECEEAARRLRVRALGSVTDLGRLSEIDDPMLRRRARHVITDTERARAIGAALLASDLPAGDLPASDLPASDLPASDLLASDLPAGDLPAGDLPAGKETAKPRHIESDNEIYRYIGTLLTDAHVSLRDDFEVSWTEADVTVDVAIAAGAYGARMIGGGFGGSVLALVPLDRLAPVRTAVTDTFARRGWTPPEFLNAVPSAAARQLA